MKNLPKLLIILFFSFFSYELLADSNKKNITKYKGNTVAYKKSVKILTDFFDGRNSFNYGGYFKPERVINMLSESDKTCINPRSFDQPSHYQNYKIEPIYSLKLENDILHYSISKFEKETDKVKTEIKKLGYVNMIQQPYGPIKYDQYMNASQTLQTDKFIIYLSDDAKSKNYNKALYFKFENNFTSIVYDKASPTTAVGFPVGTKFWKCSWSNKIIRNIFVMQENRVTQNKISHEKAKRELAVEKANKDSLRKKYQNDSKYAEKMRSQCKQIRDKVMYGGKKESYWIMTPIFQECKTLGLM
jgi:hypothetical protein